ncbi:hypothetical protein EVJ58_g10665, partial [Rhodofomes roseus]
DPRALTQLSEARPRALVVRAQLRVHLREPLRQRGKACHDVHKVLLAPIHHQQLPAELDIDPHAFEGEHARLNHVRRGVEGAAASRTEGDRAPLVRGVHLGVASCHFCLVSLNGGVLAVGAYVVLYVTASCAHITVLTPTRVCTHLPDSPLLHKHGRGPLVAPSAPKTFARNTRTNVSSLMKRELLQRRG